MVRIVSKLKWRLEALLVSAGEVVEENDLSSIKHLVPQCLCEIRNEAKTIHKLAEFKRIACLVP